MSEQSVESQEALGRITNMIRVFGIMVLLFHFYFYNYSVFREWGLTSHLGNTLLNNLLLTGLFSNFYNSKIIPVVLLALSLFSSHGKKDPDLKLQTGLTTMGVGIIVYFGSFVLMQLNDSMTHAAIWYISVTSVGYVLVLHGGNQLSRVIFSRTKKDPFNRVGQSFPQEERIIKNEHSIHFQAEYEYNGTKRKSVINMPNIYRGLLICGGSGSGKTYFVVKNLIRQQIKLGFSMLVYDLKYPDLSKLTYNCFLENQGKYPGKPAHYHINFEDLSRTNRCNCLAPYTLQEIADAVESARSVLFGLNMDWVGKQGDFWVESSINFIAGIIWFLRKYQHGKYCTWAQVIELASTSYKELFSVLRTEMEIQTLIQPFIDAFLQNNHEQLGGQVGSANIGLGRLSSPAMYYVLTGNDFTLDLNDPEYPKVLTLANSPQKTNTYGAFLSVFINTINRLACKEGMHPFSEVIDEASTVTATSLIQSIGQGRSYKIAVTLAIQDVSQLTLSYGQKYANVILNLCGNVISGQVSGESARWLSERFGKTMQDRESITINSNDRGVSHSHQMEEVIPPSRIASLSSGEFVGMVADTPHQPIRLKMFCSRIINDHKALQGEADAFQDLPIVRNVSTGEVLAIYLQTKEDVRLLVRSEIERMEGEPDLCSLVLR